MRNTSSFNLLAIVLIIVGAVFLLENFGFIDGAWLVWPILPLIIGIGFCMLFFKTKKDIVLLGLGSFVLLNSLFFFYLNVIGWSTLVVLWPIFIVILGITFLACYIASKSKVLAYLAVLLMSLGASFILIFVISTKLWPISLIFAGISFIIISVFERFEKRGRNAKKK